MPFAVGGGARSLEGGSRGREKQGGQLEQIVGSPAREVLSCGALASRVPWSVAAECARRGGAANERVRRALAGWGCLTRNFVFFHKTSASLSFQSALPLHAPKTTVLSVLLLSFHSRPFSLVVSSSVRNEHWQPNSLGYTHRVAHREQRLDVRPFVTNAFAFSITSE